MTKDPRRIDSEDLAQINERADSTGKTVNYWFERCKRGRLVCVGARIRARR